MRSGFPFRLNIFPPPPLGSPDISGLLFVVVLSCVFRLPSSLKQQATCQARSGLDRNRPAASRVRFAGEKHRTGQQIRARLQKPKRSNPLLTNLTPYLSMGYINEFDSTLRERLADVLSRQALGQSVEQDVEALLKFVKNKLLESYKNGLAERQNGRDLDKSAPRRFARAERRAPRP